MSTVAHITPTSRIPAETVEEMLALHRRYYDGVVRARFLDDLAAKDWAILLRSPDGMLAGFSTLQMLALSVNGLSHRFLFSGDTVVDTPHRLSSNLAGAFGHVLLRLMHQFGETNFHWFLITKGFRTYRFLPVFFETFIPSFGRPAAESAVRLLHAVARHKFGAAYDASSGIIRVLGGSDRLTPAAADIPAHRRTDPHVAYFLSRNPGYVDGDELACITDLTRVNLTRAAWRVIRGTQVAWDG